MKKLILKALIIISITSSAITLNKVQTYAQTQGYGQGQGRTDSVNVNDYSTSAYDRFEYNYKFKTGPNYKDTFGKSTQTDIVSRNTETENIRRNKDVAFNPPSYGTFSGEFATERSNPYITIQSNTYARNVESTTTSQTYDTLSLGVNGISSETGILAPTSLTMSENGSTQSNSVSIKTSETPQPTQSSNAVLNTVTISQPTNNKEVNIAPLYYDDGSIGRLYISKIGVNVKVFEGETLDNMKIGIGHFEATSAWDGNAALAGHNRGSADYFKDIKNLNVGDELIYETKYGTRIYKLSSKEKITDTDYSKLGWSQENMLTLITCVENEPSMRWAIQAYEKE